MLSIPQTAGEFSSDWLSHVLDRLHLALEQLDAVTALRANL
jgi:hypothetical protein